MLKNPVDFLSIDVSYFLFYRLILPEEGSLHPQHLGVDVEGDCEKVNA